MEIEKLYSIFDSAEDNTEVCEAINCLQRASDEISIKTIENRIIKFQICKKCKNQFFNNGANPNIV